MREKLVAIATVFGSASLLSFGGGNAIIPQLQLETVEENHWLSARQFADSFAIAQVAPGPSTLLVTLLGYRADGLAGALVATLAMIIPASILTLVVAKVWLQTGHARWHTALEAGMAPIAVGLVAASGLIVGRSVDHGLLGWLLTAAAAVALVKTKLGPLSVVTVGGVIGVLVGGV